MKYLLVVLVVVALVWLARSGRRRVDGAATRRARGRVEEMVTCAHCGVHLPRSDALHDGDRYYCGEAHRAARAREGDPR